MILVKFLLRCWVWHSYKSKRLAVWDGNFEVHVIIAFNLETEKFCNSLQLKKENKVIFVIRP